MSKENIIQLINHQGYPSVSILFPTHRLHHQRYTDAHKLKETLRLVKHELIEANGRRAFNLTDMLIKVEDALNQIDFNHQKEGVGLYVSPDICELVQFPFSVKERIVINYHFPSRELLYFNQVAPDFNLLALYKKSAHLFESDGEKLTEIYNEHFPAELKQEYEYEQPAVFRSNGSTVLKQYEKEESDIMEKRTVSFYRKLDKQLKDLRNPLVVAGNEEELHDFLSITSNKNNIKGTIEGNYEYDETHRLSKAAFDLFQENANLKEKSVRREVKELYGEEMSVFGIFNVWKAALEGNCQEVFVERDYAEPAYISDDETQLRRKNILRNRKYRRINDIVEKTIDKVLSKGGKVYFTENNTLKEFDRIALKLRYPE